MKRWSTPLITRELQVKTTLRYHLTPFRMTIIKNKQTNKQKTLQAINAGEDVEKRKLCCTVGRNVNWYSHYGEKYRRFFNKLGIKLPCDPAIPLLGIHSEKTVIQKDTCIPTFTAALFTIARTWKQLRCPLTDKLVKKLWYNTVEHYSVIKRNGFESVVARWMNLEPII